MNKVIIFLVKLYKSLISPLLGNHCRFHPSCSTYAIDCFRKFSFFKALWYSSLRIIKCNPFSSGGFDPCPED